MKVDLLIDFLEIQKSSFVEVINQNNENLASQNDDEEASKYLALHWNLIQMQHFNNKVLTSLLSSLDIQELPFEIAEEE